MKIGTQVYVKNSFEAAEMYCKAFGAAISFEIKNVAAEFHHPVANEALLLECRFLSGHSCTRFFLPTA